MKIPDQPLDPKIVEAASKLWDWAPGKKNIQQEGLNAPSAWFGSHRTIGHGRPADRALLSVHDAKATKQDIRRLVGRGWRLPVHDDGLCRRLFLRGVLRCARERVRRPPRRDLAGLLDRGLPLFFARLSGRPDRRPDRAAPPGDRRPAAGRRGPPRRRPGEQPVADLSRLWRRRRRGCRPLLRAEHRRGAALVRAPARHRQRPRHRRHRRGNPDRRAAGARVDRRPGLAPDLSRAGRPDGGRRRRRGRAGPLGARAITGSPRTAIRRIPAV